MSIRKQYDSDLEALRTALVEMGQNAAEAVENALEALCTADTAAAQKIVQGDDRINNMERDIEHRCMALLLRQQPVAGDLRHISSPCVRRETPPSVRPSPWDARPTR